MARRSGTEKRQRGCIITARFNAQEAEALRQLAQDRDITVGALIRATTLKAELPPPRARLRPIDREAIARLLGQLGKIGSNLNQLAKEAHLGKYRTDSIELGLRDLMELRLPLLQALGQEPVRDHPAEPHSADEEPDDPSHNDED